MVINQSINKFIHYGIMARIYIPFLKTENIDPLFQCIGFLEIILLNLVVIHAPAYYEHQDPRACLWWLIIII